MPLVAIACVHCTKVHNFAVSDQQIEELQAGQKHIQDILDNLEAPEREMFISGICPTCWNTMFADDEDEDAA